jgi:hypothetical protein
MKNIPKLMALMAIALIAMTACTKKNEAEPAQAAAMEHDASEPAFIMTDTNGYVNEFAGAVTDPPFINFDKYLNLRLRTYTDIRIWGWSKNGKAAYSSYRYHEREILTVFIFDTVNDITVWQKSLEVDCIEYDERLDVWNGKSYTEFIRDFRIVCGQNGIEFVQTPFMQVPVRHNDQTVNIIVEKNITPPDLSQRAEYGGGSIANYRIAAESQGRRKIIHEKSFAAYAYDVNVYGYFIDPFNDRALIVIGEYADGWEESVVTFSFVGCHLSVGFK